MIIIETKGFFMGRHREFDVQEVLDAALDVFWQKGYEGTSYADLTSTTGVERPGLYSAFGNKESLFKKALERYYSHHLAFFPAALELPSAKEVVRCLLFKSIELNTRFPDRRGCLGIQGALACSESAESVRVALIEARENGEGILRERLERAKEERDLPEATDCAALAAYVCAVLHGMAVQAKAGFSREKLEAVATLAMGALPIN
jgi:AcrR family transcriptional regulator